VLYLTSGLGVATLLTWLRSLAPGLAAVSSWVVWAGFMIVLGPELAVRGRAQESGIRSDAPSTLDVTDPLVAAISPGRATQIVSNEAECWTLYWACLEKLESPALVRLDIKGYRGTERDPAALMPWLASTASEVVAMVEIPRESPLYTGYGSIDLAPVRAALRADHRFAITVDRTLARGERITIWQRQR
jgi:hypothetical protein